LRSKDTLLARFRTYRAGSLPPVIFSSRCEAQD
jgi:hypothetical protein